MHNILQFFSTSFLILKSLHDSFIINATSYISFKILDHPHQWMQSLA